MADVYENSLKALLRSMEKIDSDILWVELENRVNRLSKAVCISLEAIEAWEKTPLRQGSISTLLEVKKLLTETTVEPKLVSPRVLALRGARIGETPR